MAKRNSETDKWKNPWFRKLSPMGKLLWYYFTENCDCAGFWKEDFELASFHIGAPFTQEHLREFEGKILRIDHDTLFLRGFGPFQCGVTPGKLSRANNFHKGIIERLEARGVDPETEVPSHAWELIPSSPLVSLEPLPSPSGAPPEPLPSPTKDKEEEIVIENKEEIQNEEELQNVVIPQAPACASPEPKSAGTIAPTRAGAAATPPPAPKPEPAPRPPISPVRRVIQGPWPPPVAVYSSLALPQDGVAPGEEFRRITRGLWGDRYRPPIPEQTHQAVEGAA